MDLLSWAALEMCLMINWYKVEGTMVKTQTCRPAGQRDVRWGRHQAVHHWPDKWKKVSPRPSDIQNTSNSNWKPILQSRQNFGQGKKNSDRLLNLLSKSTKNSNWWDSLICHCIRLVLFGLCSVTLYTKDNCSQSESLKEKQQSKFCKGSMTDKSLTKFVCGDHSIGGR